MPRVRKAARGRAALQSAAREMCDVHLVLQPQAALECVRVPAPLSARAESSYGAERDFLRPPTMIVRPNKMSVRFMART